MKKYAINGRFIVRNLTGQERFAIETLSELDKIVEPNFIELIIPQYTPSIRIPHYRNIKIIKWGNVKSHFWEQIDFFWYLLIHRRTGVNLCTTCPIFKPDINTIHDINQSVNKKSFTTLYGRMSSMWHGIMKYSTFHWAKKVLTVSKFSKSEIIRVFGVSPDKIYVLGNGWQHINRIKADENIFRRYSSLKDKQYYFAASSLTPQKNFNWIIKAAYNNPQSFFAIAGKKVGLTENLSSEIPNNLLFLGYVTDGEMKALMQHCKAFIHPAIYEGFGIPPLEALANGADVIVSRAACLPEIFRKSVHYIDPSNANVNLDKLVCEKVEKASEVLNAYSWESNAIKLLDILKSLQ